MGGRGSGGARVNSGPGRVIGSLRWNREQKRAKQHPAVPAPKLPILPPPDGLTEAQRAVWVDLAPHAAGERTLTPATAAAFRDLCEAIVSKARMQAQIDADGLTYLKVTIDGAGQEHQEVKAHPLISQHRGLMQRVEAGFARFRLAPSGKPLSPAVETKDEWSEFG